MDPGLEYETSPSELSGLEEEYELLGLEEEAGPEKMESAQKGRMREYEKGDPGHLGLEEDISEVESDPEEEEALEPEYELPF